jgi:hypothetical protein
VNKNKTVWDIVNLETNKAGNTEEINDTKIDGNTISDPQRVSCRNLFRRLKILPLASQYILSFMLFIVKNKNLFTLNSEYHIPSTRQLNNFYQPMTNFTTYQRAIHYMGVKIFKILIFNNLPQSIKEVSNNARKFENCLKRFLHTHSFYSLEEYFQHKSSAN